MTEEKAKQLEAQEQRNALRRLAQDAKGYADIAFTATKQGDRVTGLVSASAALSKISAAEALYYSAIDACAHQEVPNIFFLFNTFCSFLINGSEKEALDQFPQLLEEYSDSCLATPLD